jgi:hypothetical protein
MLNFCISHLQKAKLSDTTQSKYPVAAKVLININLPFDSGHPKQASEFLILRKENSMKNVLLQNRLMRYPPIIHSG